MLQNESYKNSGLFVRSNIDFDGAVLRRRSDPDVGLDLLHRVEPAGHQVLCALLRGPRARGRVCGPREVNYSAGISSSRYSH